MTKRLNYLVVDIESEKPSAGLQGLICYVKESDKVYKKTATGYVEMSTHSQNSDTGTSATDFNINGNNAIKEGDSRLTDARTPITHNQDASTINAGTLDGDRLPAISATKRGGVPMTGTPSGKYLKDNNTWAISEAALPDLVVSKNSTSENQTILTDYGAVKIGCFVISGTIALTIAGTGVLQIT